MRNQPVNECGYCHEDFLKHPIERCKYAYTPIEQAGRVIGYEMIDSPLRAIHGTDQPQT